LSGRRDPDALGRDRLPCLAAGQGYHHAHAHWVRQCSKDAARADPDARVRGVPGIAETPEGVPPRGRPSWVQEGLAGARLRHHHRRGAQDPRECTPGGPQAPHVVRPGGNQDGRGMSLCRATMT